MRQEGPSLMRQQKRFTTAFEDEAVRLALSSGRPRLSVAGDLGVGLSTLTLWIGRDRDRKRDPSSGSDPLDLAAELTQMRQENKVLRQERDILMRATAFYPRGKSMRFTLVDQAKEEFPVHRLSRALMSARAAILPGRTDLPVIASGRRSWGWQALSSRMSLWRSAYIMNSTTHSSSTYALLLLLCSEPD